MANKRPLVLDPASADLQQIQTGDVVEPAALGTGSPTSAALLRGDGKWVALAIAAAGVPALDPSRKGAGVTLTNSNQTAAFTAAQQTVIGLTGVTSGKYYFEVTFVSGTSSGNAAVGVVPQTEPLTGAQIGYSDNITGSVGCFQSSGNIYKNGSSSAVGSANSFSTAGSYLCVAVDAAARKVWFKSGANAWNGDPTANPATGVGGVAIDGTGAIHPAIGTDKVSTWTANFGVATFNQVVPSGFSAWIAGANTAQLLTPGDVSIATPANGDLIQYNGSAWVNNPVATIMTAYAPKASPVFTGTVKMPVYTLTTLPSASANTQCSIVVSNATGGPAMCISNGTNWINVRTNATVA